MRFTPEAGAKVHEQRRIVDHGINNVANLSYENRDALLPSD